MNDELGPQIPRHAEVLSELSAALDDFLGQVAVLRSEYGRTGPGKVSRPLFDAVAASHVRLCELAGNLPASAAPTGLLRQHAEKAFQMCRRCALQPSGLCFVTGEAGLVPRPDWAEQFDNAIRQLAGISSELKGRRDA